MTTPTTLSPGRPQVHFAPARNWMNDPNGLIRHNGVFHLYFQHNPEGPNWGNMSWGHATSTDLLTWQEHAVALWFDDDEEVFSGSVVFDEANSSGLGTAGNPPLIALYTSASARGQAQALAYSTDGGYTWEKHGIVLDRGTTDFRDPRVFRHQNRWIMVAVEAVDRQVHLFHSTDLREWAPLSVFGPYGAPGGVWECPDLFPIGDRWVLTLSVNPGHPTGGSGMQYIVGDFDGVRFVPARWGWLDHGHDYYAGITFSGMPEPIMLAWLSNWMYARDVPTHPWRGSTALPRRLTLRGDTLFQTPAVRVDRPRVYEASDITLPPGGFDLPAEAHGAALRIQARVRPGSAALELRVRGAANEGSAVCIRYAAGRLSVDRSSLASSDILPSAGADAAAIVPLRDGVLELDVWVDTTSVEVFADGGAVTVSEAVFTSEDHVGVGMSSDQPGVVVEHMTVTALSRTDQASR
ncbi:glycoside hydrolase family 32 protein [Actinoplanes sp. NPDC089786]|uniref:glycoside hydrolase family 32 protein n=1 Tax=Actinoplanes sp. NPDC089786 TaxID=3155185 RepID=UPI00342CC0B5